MLLNCNVAIPGFYDKFRYMSIKTVLYIFFSLKKNYGFLSFVRLLYGRFHSYINGLTMTVSIRDAMRGMETCPPLGYFRSYIGKSVGS